MVLDTTTGLVNFLIKSVKGLEGHIVDDFDSDVFDCHIFDRFDAEEFLLKHTNVFDAIHQVIEYAGDILDPKDLADAKYIAEMYLYLTGMEIMKEIFKALDLDLTDKFTPANIAAIVKELESYKP